MSLKGIYNDALLTDFLLERLRDGEVPNVDELNQELNSLRQIKPLLGEKPLISLTDTTLDKHEEASARKINDIFAGEIKDLDILYSTISEFQTRATDQLLSWSTTFSSLLRSLEELEDRVDTLLLLRQDTLGYFKYVSDDFRTLEYIDLENTTATIDTNSGMCSMMETTTGSGISRIALDEAIVDYQVVQANGLVGTSQLPGFSIQNILSDTYSQWLLFIESTLQTPILIAIRVSLEEITNVSKVVFVPFGATGTSAFLVNLLYSQDGTDYILVPGEASRSITSNPAIWTFPIIKAKYFKFLVSKNGADDVSNNDNYLYQFGARNISLYTPAHDTSVSGVLQSVSRAVLESSEQLSFTKAALNVCENIPEGTSIDYFLSVDGGETFSAIDPLERTQPINPQVLDFAKQDPETNIDSSSKWDSILSAEELDFDNNAGLSLVSANDKVLNFYIPNGEVDDVVESTYKIYRNTNSASGLVRGKKAGWYFDTERGTYNTIFRVEDPSGMSIDFGSSSAFLDGQMVVGMQLISKGDHRFETSSVNWLDISDGLTNEASLKEEDFLYPLNHKLLIEGYDYVTTYVGEQVYRGASFIAEKKLVYIPQHQFFNFTEENNTEVYTRIVDSDGDLSFIVKIISDFSDQENEHLRVQYQSSTRKFNSVVFKAILRTDDENVSPLLDAYTVKLGG